MKYTSYILSAIVVMSAVEARAQESIVPMVKELPQRIQYNPALELDNNAYFVLPVLGGLSVGVENSGFCWDDMFTKRSNDSLYFDPNKLSSRMRKYSLTALDADIPLLQFGFRVGESYFSLDVMNKTRVDVIVPRTLTDIRYGNWDYDKNVPINHSTSHLFLRAVNYVETAAGYSRNIDEKLRVGMRLKLLAGLAGAMSNDLEVNVNTFNEDNRYGIEIGTKGSINVAAPMKVELDEDGYVENVELEDLKGKDIKPFKNLGFGLDLGGTYKLTEDLTLGLAITDLGFIKWHKNSNVFSAGSNITYRGVNVNDDIKDSQNGFVSDDEDSYWDQIVDSLEKFADISYSTSAFKTRISPTVRATAEYKLKDWVCFGGSVSARVVDQRLFPNISADAQLKAKKWLTWAVSASMNHGAKFSLGSGLVLTGGAFQFYMIADRIPMKLADTNGLHFTTGINFVLGRNSDE